MTQQQVHEIEATLMALWSDVEWELRKRFAEDALLIPFRCYWCDSWDMPFVVRLGDVEDACRDVSGFDYSHVLHEVRTKGIALARLWLGRRK